MTSLRHKRAWIIFLVGLLSVVNPFAIDMYLPAFSPIAGNFKTTTSVISLSLSSYFIGFAVGQILYGPLLDRFGRKRPLYFGLILYILASIGCAQAHSIDALVALRFCPGAGRLRRAGGSHRHGTRFLSRKRDRQNPLSAFPHHRSFTAARALHWQCSGLCPWLEMDLYSIRRKCLHDARANLHVAAGRPQAGRICLSQAEAHDPELLDHPQAAAVHHLRARRSILFCWAFRLRRWFSHHLHGRLPYEHQSFRTHLRGAGHGLHRRQPGQCLSAASIQQPAHLLSRPTLSGLHRTRLLHRNTRPSHRPARDARSLLLFAVHRTHPPQWRRSRTCALLQKRRHRLGLAWISAGGRRLTHFDRHRRPRRISHRRIDGGNGIGRPDRPHRRQNTHRRTHRDLRERSFIGPALNPDSNHRRRSYRRTGVPAYRRIGVSAYRRIGVSAYRRISVSAYRRIGISAYRRRPNQKRGTTNRESTLIHTNKDTTFVSIRVYSWLENLRETERS